MYARLARAEMLVERASITCLRRSSSATALQRIVFRHGLPNIISSSIVFSMSDFVLKSCWSRA